MNPATPTSAPSAPAKLPRRRHGALPGSDDIAFRLWHERSRGQPPVAMPEKGAKRK